MHSKHYIDLLITDDDITLNSGNEPTLCCNEMSIAQDIRHAIIESYLATKLIAERSPVLRSDIFTQIILLVERDRRIIPGTTKITEESTSRLFISTKAYQYGSIHFGVNYE